MRYKYIDKHGRLLAESDSPIKFNEKLFPITVGLEPTKTEHKQATHYKEDNK